MADDPAKKEGRSWRDLDQSVNPRTLSSQGRRRMLHGLVHGLLAGFLVAGFAWGAWEVVGTIHGDGAMTDPVNATPLREIVLINDANGVLTQDWVERTLAVKPGSPLLELDLGRLRERLLAVGQVRAVELRRDFPGTLVVGIRERIPVVRLRVQAGGDAPRTLLVARDGVVYEGIGYTNDRLAALPWLDGVTLVRNRRGGFGPIDGLEDVANLLQTTQNAAPLLYADWRIVSLARLGGYDEIVVKTRSIPEVVFSRKLDYTQQLARLDYIAGYTRIQPEAVVQRVDLSLGGNVPVALERGRAVPFSNPSVQTPNPRTRRDL